MANQQAPQNNQEVEGNPTSSDMVLDDNGNLVNPNAEVEGTPVDKDTDSDSFLHRATTIDPNVKENAKSVTLHNLSEGVQQEAAQGTAGAIKMIANTPFLGKAVRGISDSIGDALGLPPLQHDPYEMLHQQAQADQPQNTGQQLGYGGSSLIQFISGDEALKGISYAGKLEAAAKVAKLLEQYPRVMEALRHGARLQQLAKDYPALTDLIGNAVRGGAVQTAQTTARTGGDIKQGLKEGGIATAAGAVVGAPLAAAESLGAKATEAAGTVEKMNAVARHAPDQESLAEHLSGQINKVADDTHTNYEEGVKDFSKRLKGQTLPVEDSPLSKAAQDILDEIKGDKSKTHPLISQTKDAIGANLKPEVKSLVSNIARKAEKPTGQAAADLAATGKTVDIDLQAQKIARAENPTADSTTFLKRAQELKEQLLSEQKTEAPEKQVITGDVSRNAAPGDNINQPVVDADTGDVEAPTPDPEKVSALQSKIQNLQEKAKSGDMKAVEELRSAQDDFLKMHGVETPQPNATSAEQAENFKTRNKERAGEISASAETDSPTAQAAFEGKVSKARAMRANAAKKAAGVESSSNVNQSGHGPEGGSLEEINRNEKFIRVGPNGIKEYQGISPDVSSPLKKSEAVLAMKPDGTWRLQDGNLDTATKHADTVKDLLKLKPQTKPQPPLSVDDLITLRQQVRQLAGHYDYGDVNSRTLRRLLPSIDDSIESLANKSGDTKLSDDYAKLRSEYKGKINALDDNTIDALRQGKVDVVAKKFLNASGKARENFGNLQEVLGDRGMESFRKEVFSRSVADATNMDGRFDPVKFTKTWDKISPEIRDKFFNTQDVTNGIQQLTHDAKSAANFQKLVRYGVLPAPGVAVVGGLAHAYALTAALGTLANAGAEGIGTASKLLDDISNNPKIWSSIVAVGKVAKGVKAARVPQAAANIAATSAGGKNKARQVYEGARSVLGTPIQQDQSGVYSNQ